jgi:hypothetical protein
MSVGRTFCFDKDFVVVVDEEEIDFDVDVDEEVALDIYK